MIKSLALITDLQEIQGTKEQLQEIQGTVKQLHEI